MSERHDFDDLCASEMPTVNEATAKLLAENAPVVYFAMMLASAVVRAAEPTTMPPTLGFEKSAAGQALSADHGRLSVAVDVDFTVASAQPHRRLCSYSARIHGTTEHISGREPFATALRVVGEWAAERRGLWASPSE